MHRISAGPFARVAVAAILGGLFLTATARAQQAPGSLLPAPRLTSIVPLGGKVGTVVELSWTGTDVEEPQKLVFSDPTIKAEPIIPPPPPPPDPKNPPKDPPKPAPVTKFKVTIPANTPLGFHDVRLVNKWGVSNPRTFVVGDLEEVLEKEPNNDVQEAQKIVINNTVSGVIVSPVDVDYYSFPGKAGQRVVVSCLALSIDSRLQAAVEVYDAQGKRLAGNDHYGNNRHDSSNDALTDVVLPADGDYQVRVYQFAHTQGGPEFFYRLTVSTTPWIDAVFPPVVEPGKPATLTLYGRNLPGGKPDPASVIDGSVLDKVTVTVNAPNDPLSLKFSGRVSPGTAHLDGFEYRVKGDAGMSNPVLLALARTPVVLDNESNDTQDKAQPITVPCTIAGRIEKKRDRDWYSFTAKKGDVYNIEVTSDRLGAPTDMYFVLRNPTTKSDIIEGDDNPDTLSPKFFTRTDDPAIYRFVVPADGPYLLLVGSRTADTQADPRHGYSVRIAPDAPDFRVLAVPSDYYRPDGTNLLQGASEALTIFAWRTDGMDSDITITAEGLPKGVTCPPQVLGRKMRQVTMVFTAAADAPPAAGEIKLKATATIKGQPVTREVRAGGVTSIVQPQQGIPTVSRMERGIWLAVADKAPFAITAAIDKASVVQGDKASITLKVNRLLADLKAPIAVAPYDLPQQGLPQNLVIAPANVAAADGTMAVTVNANVEPGTYNIVLRGTVAVPFNKDPKAAQKQPVNVVIPSTPVMLTVLPKVVGQVTAAVANPNVKVGTQTEVVVKVTRMYDYAGEYKVQLVLPANSAGITAADAVIAAGADEVKLILKADAAAAAGARPDLLVRTTAMWNGNVPVVQDSAKFAVTVVK